MTPIAVTGQLVPAKIVMKGNSTMTLHERFSDIKPPKVVVKKIEPVITARLDIGDFSADNYKNRRAGAIPSSYNNNQRLARQMSTRPSVRAALHSVNKSVRQRLGARARIGFPPRYAGGSVEDEDDDALDRLDSSDRISPYDDLDRIYKSQRFGYFNSRYNSNRRFYGYRAPQRRRFGYQQSYNNRGFKFGRYESRRRNGYSRNFKNQRRFQPRPKVNKDELDKDIDAYMAKTKLQLDADMDVFMADVNSSF